MLSATTSVAAVIFAAFIAILLALLTDWLLASSFGDWASRKLGGLELHLSANDPINVIYNSPGRLLVALALGVAFIGWVLGRFINTNRFSLHYYWRNRMMRAYLCVSRKQKEDGNSDKEDEKKKDCERVRDETKNRFTDFDRCDNLQMYELKQKLES